MKPTSIFILSILFCSFSCTQKRQETYTPWGESIYKEDMGNTVSIDDILSNGEMIMVTMSGPDTYYEYHGKYIGTQYLICEKFAQKLGVSLRVDVCKSEEEMMKKINNGDADIIAYQLSKNKKNIVYCGYAASDSTSWGVSNKDLAKAIDEWYNPQVIADIRKEETMTISSRGIHRRVYAPMLNAKSGVISQYDHLFMKYAPIVRWDWRLLAAQCYQESCFDPNAYSWAGARGLMQIMPNTAKHLGLPIEKICDPEENIYASVRYINELNSKFKDVRDSRERQFFVLASYNGGFFHIRDAMTLAKKSGKNPYCWDNVAEYILKLRNPDTYNDPSVRYGYMRGDETVGYVDRIRNRWLQYMGKAHKGMVGHMTDYPLDGYTPHKANIKHRFTLKDD